MSNLKVDSINIGNSVNLPIFTNSTRPTGQEGLLIYNSEGQDLELFTNGNWVKQKDEIFSPSYIDKNIVLDGLQMYLDSSISQSYPGPRSEWDNLVDGARALYAPKTWYDLSGNNYHMTIHNQSPFVSHLGGGSFYFDGDDSKIRREMAGTFISDPELNNLTMSYSFWVRVIDSSSYYIVSSGAQTGSSGITFSYQNGSPFFGIKGRVKNGFGYFDVSLFPLDTWIQWTVVGDGNICILYKNGVQVSSVEYASSGGASNTQTDLTIGVPNNAETSYEAKMYFNMLMIYDRALTISEVQQNYTATKGIFGL